MRLVVTTCVFLCAFAGLPRQASAQAEPQHPRIIGLSHVAIYAGDIAADRLFYENLLGFSSPFSMKHLDGTDWIINIKVNDEQFIELFAESPKDDGPLNHFAFYTDNAKALADRIKNRGIHLVGDLHTGQTGNDFFSLRDPDGHLIEIVEYTPGGRTVQDRGLFLPAKRASNHILSVGIRVRSAVLAAKFYRDILGLQEVLRSAPSARQPGSISMRVPGGGDEVRLLLFTEFPATGQQTIDEYVSLADARSSESSHSLKATPSNSGDRTGKIDETTQALYDPGGMRIEMRKPVPPHLQPTAAPSQQPGGFE